MLKTKQKPHFLTIPRMACVLLALVTIGLQFLPCWDMGSEEGVLSIADVLWLPYKHAGIDAYFESFIAVDRTVNPFVINQVILFPVLIFAMAIISFVLCFTMKGKGYTFAVLACGLLTVVGYLVRPELQMGSMWYVHIIPGALMLIVAVLEFVGIFDKKEK